MIIILMPTSIGRGGGFLLLSCASVVGSRYAVSSGCMGDNVQGVIPENVRGRRTGGSVLITILLFGFPFHPDMFQWM